MDPAAYEQIINRGSPTFNADGSITYDKLGESLFGVPATATPSGTAPQGGSDLQNLMQKYGGR
jgi:hypothetical protein